MGAFYDLSVKLTLDTTGLAAGASVAMRFFAALQKTAGITGAQIDSLGKSLKVVLAGAAVTGVGFGLFSFVDKAAKRAGDLETILVGIQNRTGRPLIDPRTGTMTAAGASFTTGLTNIGLGNQMSTTDVARVAQAASRAGITTPGQLDRMLKPLANYAEVMFSSTKADPETSARIATEISHMYGAFGDKKIHGVTDTQFLVDLLGKAMQVTPGTQSQFMTLLAGFVGTARPLYKNRGVEALMTDTIAEAALMSQMGQGLRGGNQIARLMTNMAGGARGKSAQAAIAGIQRGSGIRFTDSHGNIDDPLLMMRALANTALKLDPAHTASIFSRAFSANGARLAGLFSDPTVGRRLETVFASLKGMPDTAAQQRAYNQSLPGQQIQAQKNWDSAYTNFGLVALPAITRFATAMADATAGLVRFTQQHPALLKFIATLMLVTAGVLLFVGPLMILVGVIGAVSAVLGVVATIGLVPLIVIILAVGAALVGLTLFIMNFGKIMHEVGAGLHNLAVMFGFIKEPAVPTIPHGNLPPGGAAQMTAFRHGHYEVATGGVWRYQDTGTNKWHTDGRYTPGKGGGGPVWDMPVIHGRGGGTGGGVTINLGGVHVAPNAIAVQAHPHQNAHQIAEHAVTLMGQKLGDELLHTLTSGAHSAFGLSPVLAVPAHR